MINLPKNLRDSTILSDTDKNALAQVEILPLVDPSFTDVNLKNIVQYFALTPDEMDVELHKYASQLLTEGKVNEAWQILLTSG